MQSLIPASYPIIKESYGLDFVQIGIITLTFQIAGALLQPIIGMATDRYPAPYSPVVGMMFTLSGLVNLAFAQTYEIILISVALIGVGSSIFHPEAKVINTLNKNHIKLNITAVYSSEQTKQILKNINKKTKVIISIFAGRAGDAGKDPIPEFKKSILMAKKFKNVEILWASVREPYNYTQAKQIGCHIITVPPPLIEKIQKFGKSFKSLTKETVNGFLKDAKKAKFKI